MKFQTIKIPNVTCKGFIKTLSTMLIKINGVSAVEINYKDTEVCFQVRSAISKEILMEQLIAAGLDSSGKVKSCNKCVLEKLNSI